MPMVSTPVTSAANHAPIVSWGCAPRKGRLGLGTDGSVHYADITQKRTAVVLQPLSGGNPERHL